MGTVVGMETNKPRRRKAPATVTEINSYREPGRYSVGDGLLLVVNASGSRSWLARVRDPSGKRRDIGLGRYPEVSLKEARERAADHRKTARDGLDPVAEKRRAKNVTPTFKEAAERAYAERKAGFRNEKHSWQWLNTLKAYVFPHFGSLPVDQVTVPIVVRALKPIWNEKPETARRVLQRIGTVIAWSVAHGYREHEASMQAIRMGLPPQTDRVVHHPALAYSAAPEVVRKLQEEPTSVARAALLFLILTAARSGEVRGARWCEVDLDARVWTVPADRIKMGVEHTVPLNSLAVDLLKERAAVASGDLIFPGISNSRSRKTSQSPLSDKSLTKAAKAVAEGITVHGWRSTFRDWGAEETSFASEVLEKALAHQIPSAVERAYRRGDLLEKRRQLMEAWANFLVRRPANVVPLKEVA